MDKVDGFYMSRIKAHSKQFIIYILLLKLVDKVVHSFHKIEKGRKNGFTADFFLFKSIIAREILFSAIYLIRINKVISKLVLKEY